MNNSIVNQIPIDLKKAMLAKEKVKIAALRAIKSAFILENTKEDSSGNIDNNLAQQIILKLHKQRMDAYNIYVEQNRSDLADEEFQQAKVLENYLPKRLSEEEVRSEIKEIVNVLGATSMADMGKVMGKAMNSLKGKADGAIISKLVKEILK
ncbi:MAG: glutamyl-tRNA amidotransferase [Crocinitomicaceae bacterium]|nr:glutamyl-tRNA amidotransferase [Crocinitomicaceae bacterium]|tara:strand:- start:2952 stop:3407 length:456 start_codon:yes stop_codon:yes gene_type:complete